MHQGFKDIERSAPLDSTRSQPEIIRNKDILKKVRLSAEC